jgi:hypothetical protein
MMIGHVIFGEPGGVLFEDIVHICLQTSFTVLKDAEEPGESPWV